MTPPTVDHEAPAPSPLATPEPWDLVADAYAAEVLPVFEPFSRDALKLADLPVSPRIVDVATGPGTLAILAAAGGAKVSAIDFSAPMITRLQQRLQEGGVTGIEAQVGDGQALLFETATYDGAFSMFGLMFFPDRAAGFRELFRVLRSRGRAVVGSWAPYRGPFLAVMDSLCAVLPDLPFKNGGWPLSDPDSLAREMRDAGFTNVTVHTITHSKTSSSSAELWATLQRSMAPIVLLRRRMGEERWSEIAGRIFARLWGELGDGPVEVPLTAYLGVGAK